MTHEAENLRVAFRLRGTDGGHCARRGRPRHAERTSKFFQFGDVQCLKRRVGVKRRAKMIEQELGMHRSKSK